jgi:molecular chaperone DnaK
MTHSVEKTLKDLGDKVDAAERARVESAISDLRSALKSDDKGVIEKKTDALAQASAAIAQRAYASEQPAGANGPDAAAAGAGAQGSAAGRDDVVDAEFEEVKDKDRKAS